MEGLPTRRVAAVALALWAAAGLAACGGRSAAAGGDTSQAASSVSAAAAAAASSQPATAARREPDAIISDRYGHSWSGRLGDTVQIDWYDQASGRTLSEQVAVLAVRRLPTPGGEDVPHEFGDDIGPYEWMYGIKVRLTGLDRSTVRTPLAWRSLELSDGTHVVDGVAGLGRRAGPDPSRAGVGSVGWLTQRTEEGFVPTRVLMVVGPWQATWSLE